MELGSHATLLFQGAAFGLLAALAGGWMDYRLRLRRPEEPRRGPALILVVVGALLFLGLVAIAASLLATGGTRPALVLGLGVGIGFNVGFVLLVLLYLISRRS
jgi:hypothetical protein